jgi:60 kDa SS-A/Ro ribonucleoprotein
LVQQKLSDKEAIKKSRIHPMQALAAYYTYRQGHGIKGSLSWTPVSTITDVTEALFYHAFNNVEPSNKNFLLALDVSGSMAGGGYGSAGSVFPGFTPAMGTACLAMVLARREPYHEIVGFASTIKDLGIHANDTLATAMHKVVMNNFGSTDCSAAYSYATSQKRDVDCFVIMTDNETNGGVQPYQALNRFRKERNRPNAKAIVVGMTATGFTIADPQDPHQLDIVGYDTETPALISNFAKD